MLFVTAQSGAWNSKEMSDILKVGKPAELK